MPKDLKLCAGAWGFREVAIRAYLQACARLGFRFAEMNLTDAPGTRHLSPDPSRSDLDAMARAEQASGVKVVCLCAGNDFTDADPDRVRQSVARVSGYVDMACDCGAEVVRVFAGWTPFESLRGETYRRCGAALAEVGAHGQDKGVLALENHGGPTATAAQVRRLLELADHPNVKANFDGGNFAKCKEDPLAAYQVLRGRIGYTHWKDVRPAGGELEYCALGDGISDWTPVVEALLADGYEGYWAMEYEEPADVEAGMQKCLDVVRATAKVGQA